jgi:FkbM family methyltransferase
MSIIDFARDNIQEGMFKDFLRELYAVYKVSKSFMGQKNYNFSFSPRHNSYSIEFNDGNLAGIRILFPLTSLTYIGLIPIELPGYFAMDNLKKYSLIVDGGAFPGDFTVAAAKSMGEGKVIAFEPDPSNREYLERVVKINKVSDKVEILPFALSDRVGEAYLHSNLTGSTISYDSFSRNPIKKRVCVQTTTLDNVLEKRGVLNNDEQILVKMDIEGSELDACDGAINTINNGAVFLIASYHIVNGEKTFPQLERIFSKLEYQTIEAYSKHLTLMAYPKSQQI